MTIKDLKPIANQETFDVCSDCYMFLAYGDCPTIDYGETCIDSLREANKNIQRYTELSRFYNKVRKYTDIGGYPIFHVTKDGGVLCADCIEDNEDQCADPNDAGFYVTGHGVNWEDPHLHCDHCHKRIESAYAEDDN